MAACVLTSYSYNLECFLLLVFFLVNYGYCFPLSPKVPTMSLFSILSGGDDGTITTVKPPTGNVLSSYSDLVVRRKTGKDKSNSLDLLIALAGLQRKRDQNQQLANSKGPLLLRGSDECSKNIGRSVLQDHVTKGPHGYSVTDQSTSYPRDTSKNEVHILDKQLWSNKKHNDFIESILKRKMSNMSPLFNPATSKDRAVHIFSNSRIQRMRDEQAMKNSFTQKLRQHLIPGFSTIAPPGSETPPPVSHTATEDFKKGRLGTIVPEINLDKFVRKYTNLSFNDLRTKKSDELITHLESNAGNKSIEEPKISYHNPHTLLGQHTVDANDDIHGENSKMSAREPTNDIVNQSSGTNTDDVFITSINQSTFSVEKQMVPPVVSSSDSTMDEGLLNLRRRLTNDTRRQESNLQNIVRNSSTEINQNIESDTTNGNTNWANVGTSFPARRAPVLRGQGQISTRSRFNHHRPHPRGLYRNSQQIKGRFRNKPRFGLNRNKVINPNARQRQRFTPRGNVHSSSEPFHYNLNRSIWPRSRGNVGIKDVIRDIYTSNPELRNNDKVAKSGDFFSGYSTPRMHRDEYPEKKHHNGHQVYSPYHSIKPSSINIKTHKHDQTVKKPSLVYQQDKRVHHGVRKETDIDDSETVSHVVDTNDADNSQRKQNDIHYFHENTDASKIFVMGGKDGGGKPRVSQPIANAVPNVHVHNYNIVLQPPKKKRNSIVSTVKEHPYAGVGIKDSYLEESQDEFVADGYGEVPHSKEHGYYVIGPVFVQGKKRFYIVPSDKKQDGEHPSQFNYQNGNSYSGRRTGIAIPVWPPHEVHRKPYAFGQTNERQYVYPSVYEALPNDRARQLRHITSEDYAMPQYYPHVDNTGRTVPSSISSLYNDGYLSQTYAGVYSDQRGAYPSGNRDAYP